MSERGDTVNGCGAPAGGASATDATGQAVVQGRVLRDQEPVASGYVRLLDESGEFAGEVPTAQDGSFRFYAAPGTWTVRALASGGARAEGTVVAERGTPADLELTVG